MISIIQHLSTASLQHLAGVLHQAHNKGLDINALKFAVDNQLAGRMAVFTHHPMMPAPPEMTSPAPDPCPSRGCQGILEDWPTSSALAGVAIIGCRLCRYSRIKG